MSPGSSTTRRYVTRWWLPALPDTLAVGRAYRGEVSVVDRYGNARSDDREVVISADQEGVSSSSPVGAGRRHRGVLGGAAMRTRIWC